MTEIIAANTNQIVFLADLAVQETELAVDDITAAWANSVYPDYSHYGEDCPTFTAADVAAIKTMAKKGKAIAFLSEQAVREGTFCEDITDEWADLTYRVFAGEYEDPNFTAIDFTDADIATIRTRADEFVEELRTRYEES